MPRISTKFFGELDCDADSVFFFPSGLPGFEEAREFVFLKVPEREPLLFLQSVSSRNLCFILLPILTLDPRFHLELNREELRELELPEDSQPAIGRDILCAALVGAGDEATPCANLMAPLVVNLLSRVGIQVIHPESGYSHRQPILVGEPAYAC